MSVARITIRQALRDAMAEEMRLDPRVFLLGEDVSLYEGAYKVSKDLLREFGEYRVIDSPISEAGFAGLGIGAAYKGLRPIIEFMTWNFGMQAFDQISNSASKIHYMSGGEITCPIVFRGANGPAMRLAATHSQCLASTFATQSGLKVVMPSKPYNAKGLLKASIRDPNPIVFLENELEYGRKGEVPTEEYIVDLEKADVVKEGSDLTIIAYGKMVNVTENVVGEIEEELGISIELIDLQTIKPFDEETLKKSISKTHRVLVVEESSPFASIASELVTWINMTLWDMLDAQPEKLSALDIPMPYADNLEKMVTPRETEIKAKIREFFVY